jgi:erythronate-4-phosphate dehydrogenase
MTILADMNIPFAEEMYSPLGDVQLRAGHAITSELVKPAEVLLVRSVTKVTRDLLEGSAVRFVGTATIGTDHIELEYLRRRNIRFASAPGSNANSVAEYLLATLLVVAERYGFSLKGTRLGVVGAGNVGSKVARLAGAMGMTVLENDPPLERATRGARFRPLSELMESDIITLHVPLTLQGSDATYHFFDGKRLGAMKPGAILINTSRGAVVETQALKEALRRKHLRSCALDVWENEPAIDTDLVGMAAVGTPHIAGYSLDGKVNGAEMIYREVCDFLGVRPSWSREGKLPAPRYENLVLHDVAEPQEVLIRESVLQCYDLLADDVALREMIRIPAGEQAAYFRGLRKNYPVRREFSSTRVILPPMASECARLFRSIGFTAEEARPE